MCPPTQQNSISTWCLLSVASQKIIFVEMLIIGKAMARTTEKATKKSVTFILIREIRRKKWDGLLYSLQNTNRIRYSLGDLQQLGKDRS